MKFILGSNGRRIATTVVVVLYAFAHFVLFVIGYPGEPLLAPDSVTYQTWSPLVPIGYPLFLAVVPTNTVPIAQFGIFIAAVLALFFAIRLTSIIAAGFAVVALLSFSPAWFYSMSVLTESLTISLIVLHVAAVAWLIARPNVGALIAIGATVAAAGLIRPSSYFLFASMAVVPFIVSRHRLRSTSIAIGSAVLIFGAGALSSYAVRGVATQTLGGMAMYGHVAHLFDPAKSALPDAIKAEAVAIRDEINEKRAEAQSIEDRQKVEMWGFNPANHRIVAFMPDGSQSEIFSQLSREAILADPVGYAKTVAENVYAAYAVWTLAENGAASSALLEQRLDRPVGGHLALTTLGRFHKIPGALDRLWVLKLFAASLVILTIGFKSPLAWIGLYAGGVHFAGITFTSIATVFIPRYASPLDAMMLVSIACAVGFVLIRLRRTRLMLSSKQTLPQPSHRT